MRGLSMMITAFAACFSSAYCAETNAIGQITTIQSISQSHPNASARGITLFQFSGSPSACVDGLWILDSDKAILSDVLAAKSAKLTVKVYYDPVIQAPWAGSGATCRVNSVIVQ